MTPRMGTSTTRNSQPGLWRNDKLKQLLWLIYIIRSFSLFRYYSFQCFHCFALVFYPSMDFIGTLYQVSPAQHQLIKRQVILATKVFEQSLHVNIS